MSLTFAIFKKCDHCGHDDYKSFNITHNLNKMAHEIGVYNCLWRPEENDYKTVKEIIPILENGIQLMTIESNRLREFNSPNGWGDHASFLDWLIRVLEHCKSRSDHNISSDR